MLELAVATLRTQSRRYLAPGLAIVLGVAFVAATLVLGSTLSASALAGISGDLRHYAAVVTPTDEDGVLQPSVVQRVEAASGVHAVRTVRRGYASLVSARHDSFVVLSTPPSPTSRATVTDGRLPSAPGEVAVSATVAAAAGTEVGQSVRIGAEPGSPGGATSAATVVGVVDAGRDPRYGGATPVVFAVDAQVVAWTGSRGYAEVDVVAAAGAGPDAVRDSVAAVAGRGATVRTGVDQAQHEVTRVTGGTDFLTALLLAFGVIALFVSALVMANTFAILLARRARETALLRCVGATRGQVLASTVVEALVLGLAASVAGVLAGIGLARVMVALGQGTQLGSGLTDFTLSARAVGVPFAVGVLVTVLATLAPIVRSTRISPLAALRPAAALRLRSRAGVVRIVTGLVLVLLGGALLALGAAAPLLPAGLAGGVLSFVGILLVGSMVVPAVARVVGAVPAMVGGVPARLAVDNAVRHPARAAATASTLLVGVTLIAMMTVGAATGESSVTRVLDREFPVDLSVTAAGPGLPAATVQRLGEVPGVQTTAPLPMATVRVGDRAAQSVVGIGAGARQVLRYSEPLADLRPGTVLVSESTAHDASLRDGQRLSLAGPDGSRVLTVAVGVALGYPYAVTDTDLRALDGSAPTRAVWLRLADDASASDVLDAVNRVVADVSEVEVGGAAPRREELTKVLDVTLAVVISLLGISVLIAVVGIANALSLSVIERTRESALLRALGLTRGQLRAMLAVEAGLLAGVATVLGVGLGTLYGWLGPMSILGADMDVALTVPWGRVGLIAAGALVAGLLASVLPARRAARVAPASALAAE